MYKILTKAESAQRSIMQIQNSHRLHTKEPLEHLEQTDITSSVPRSTIIRPLQGRVWMWTGADVAR